MIDEVMKTKVKIFFVTFILLTIFTNYYESRTNTAKNIQTTPNSSAAPTEKTKAEPALVAMQQQIKKQQNDGLKTEQEYADLIKTNLEKNCNFWKNQYILSKRAEDKLERDNACKLVNKYFQ